MREAVVEQEVKTYVNCCISSNDNVKSTLSLTEIQAFLGGCLGEIEVLTL
jgi:hypothetical protein